MKKKTPALLLPALICLALTFGACDNIDRPLESNFVTPAPMSFTVEHPVYLPYAEMDRGDFEKLFLFVVSTHDLVNQLGSEALAERGRDHDKYVQAKAAYNFQAGIWNTSIRKKENQIDALKGPFPPDHPAMALRRALRALRYEMNSYEADFLERRSYDPETSENVNKALDHARESLDKYE